MSRLWYSPITCPRLPPSLGYYASPVAVFFFKQKTAYEIGLGIPAEPLFRSAVPSFVSGAMAKAGKGLLEGTLQAGTSAVSDKLLDLVGLGGKSAADKGKDTRDYLAAAFPELNAWERAGAD